MKKKIIGHARIMQIFKASGVGNIAGCIVEEGRITRDSVVRITRGSEKVYEGPIASLKHFKDEVKEIKAGMVFEKFNDIQPEDMIEAHIMAEAKIGFSFYLSALAGGLTSMIGLDKRWLAPYGIDPDTAFSTDPLTAAAMAVTHFRAAAGLMTWRR